MEVEIQQAEESARIVLKGLLDEQGAKLLESRLAELRDETLKEVVFDFGAVTRVGSAGIGQLLNTYKFMALNGGAVRVEHVSEDIYQLFQTLKLETLFPFFK